MQVESGAMFRSGPPQGIENAFRRMKWASDRMILDDLVFRIRYAKDDATWDLGDQCLMLFKNKNMMERYRAFFKRNADIGARHMLELGIFEGGSIALWREVLRPEIISAVDLRDPIPTPYLDNYIKRTPQKGAVHIHWQFDQSDREGLRRIVREELKDDLDLVMDDASHLYTPTKISFETVFPLVKPGGVYIIEDWAWNHVADYLAPNHPWAAERSPSELAFQIMEAMASGSSGIERIEAFGPFLAVVRDGNRLPPDYSLDERTKRRPTPAYSWFA